MFSVMPTHTSSQMNKPAGRAARLLLGLTGALLALLILNLAVFDDLRIDPSAGVLETFAKPQHLASLVAVLIAGALVAFRHRSAARVAMVVAWIEISAFTFFHVIPVEVGPSKPYWGDGARLAAERDIGDDGASATPLGELLNRDHDGTLAVTGVRAAFDERRATRTMAALTARIDRRPTHCSGSPMPSPQYGLEGPTSTGMT